MSATFLRHYSIIIYIYTNLQLHIRSDFFFHNKYIFFFLYTRRVTAFNFIYIVPCFFSRIYIYTRWESGYTVSNDNVRSFCCIKVCIYMNNKYSLHYYYSIQYIYLYIYTIGRCYIKILHVCQQIYPDYSDP